MTSLRTMIAGGILATGMTCGLNAGIAAADFSPRDPSNAGDRIAGTAVKKGHQPRSAKRAQVSVTPELEADTASPEELWRQAREDGARLTAEELRRVWTWSQYISKS